jgi:hypothetical protein
MYAAKQDGKITIGQPTSAFLGSVWVVFNISSSNKRFNPICYPLCFFITSSKPEFTKVLYISIRVGAYIFWQAFVIKVCLHKTICRFNNRLGASKIDKQFMYRNIVISVFKCQYILDICTTPAVDGLVIISNHKQHVQMISECFDEFLLNGINVLIFIDKKIFVFFDI